ncbi:hypothetical protein [Infirmifilum sp. NZ]|uniref:hypothetical protein n=1 Tax=Infirmifilum sp. NZ TaxID=2926850 RepID=UPI0027A088E2|nr:hypothetical protein [Infirmifilum sp. NZ]UNQ73463.1 hypothetical protein MOV14_00270 [Infirmifilum sp. NZ]
MRKTVGIGLLALAVISAVALFSSVVVLGPGVVAVVYDPLTGFISGPHVGPSAFLKAPWQGVVRGSCGVEVVELSGRPDSSRGPVAARTRDGVEVWVDLALAYSVGPSALRGAGEELPGARLRGEGARTLPGAGGSGGGSGVHG